MKINVSDEFRLDSATWTQVTGVIVYDPDGWDRQNFQASWGEKITIAEFRRRAGKSTVDFGTYDAAFH